MTDGPHSRLIECPDCKAGPGNGDTRIVSVKKDPNGEYVAEEIWHLEDCPEYTLQQILMEESARRAKESHEWEQAQFPVTLERFRAAVAEAAAAAGPQPPFVHALEELVEAQAKDTERFVTLDRFIETLERHFPGPDGPARPPHG